MGPRKHFYRFGGDVNHIRNFVLWPGFTPSESCARYQLSGRVCQFREALCGDPDNHWRGPCPLLQPRMVFPSPSSGALGTAVNFTPAWWRPFRPTGGPMRIAGAGTQLLSSPEPQLFRFFFQDQWKITPKLTFNYGLRYDLSRAFDQMDVSHKGFSRASVSPIPRTGRPSFVRLRSSTIVTQCLSCSSRIHSGRPFFPADLPRIGEPLKRRLRAEYVSLRPDTGCTSTGSNCQRLFHDGPGVLQQCVGSSDSGWLQLYGSAQSHSVLRAGQPGNRS